MGGKGDLLVTADVKILPVQHRERFQPSATIIKEAEAILAMAKEGKLQGFGWILVYHDGLTPAGESSSGWHHEPGTKFAMSHALGQLNHRWHQCGMEQGQ